MDPITENQESFSPYNYVLDNPERYIDPDGREASDPPSYTGAALAYLGGVANAVYSNITGGLPGTLRDPKELGEYSEYAAAGQTAGHILSIGIGVTEIAVSTVGTTVEGVAAPETVGLTALAIPVTIALGTHGALTSSAAIKNLLNPTKVEAKSSNTKTKNRTATEHKKNQRNSTEQKHERNQAIKAREQNAADKKYNETKSTKEKKTNNQRKKENPDYKRLGPKREK